MADLTKYSSIIIFVLSSLLGMAVYYIKAEDEKAALIMESRVAILKIAIDNNTSRLEKLTSVLEKQLKLPK